MIIKDKVGVEIEQRPEVIQMGNGLNATSDGMGTATIALDVDGLTLTNTTTDNTISVDQNGNVGTTVATDGAIHIENTGNTGIGLGVYTNIGATSDAPLVVIKSDNVGCDQDVVQIINDGIGKGLFIDQNGAAIALEVDSASTTTHAVKISSATVATNAVFLYTNAIRDAGTALLKLQDDNASNTRSTFFIQNDGSGATILLDSNGSGKAIDIAHDDTGSDNTIHLVRSGNNAATIYGMRIICDNAGGAPGGINLSSFAPGEITINFPAGAASAIDPSITPETGWINVGVGGSIVYIPYYAAA